MYICYLYRLIINNGGGNSRRVCRSATKREKNKRGVAMKKISIFAIAVLMALTVTGISFAEVLDMSEIIAQKRMELEGTEWVVEVSPRGEGRTETDVISFYDGKVSSRNLATMGFPPTNYSLRIEETGIVTWETMQSTESGAKAFFRGDMVLDGMVSGVLSIDNGRGEPTTYNFSGSSV